MEPASAPAALSGYPGCDEFGLLADDAREAGLSYARPAIRRIPVSVARIRTVSVIVWGEPEPARVVYLHGGAGNAHTWDTVALTLGWPALAIDLPGHGHSDRAATSRRDVFRCARDVERVLDSLAPFPTTVVGSSLGGLIGIDIAARRSDLVRRLVLVDVTPGLDAGRTARIHAFHQGPRIFDSLDEMVRMVAALKPGRDLAGLRRSVLHNSVQVSDGRWVWRHDRWDDPSHEVIVPWDYLWDELPRVVAPIVLVHGGSARSVVTREHIERLRRQVPDVRTAAIPEGGHALQTSHPGLIALFAAG